MGLLKQAVLAAELAFSATAGASGCTLSVPANAARHAVPTDRINTALLDAAVRAEVNLARCRSGLRPLRAAGPALARNAEAHSRWMVSARNLTHRSNVSGRGSPVERVRAAGIRPRLGSENIGHVSRYQIDGVSFRILDAASCSFASQSGQPLPPHTYASLARQIVGAWMSSASHRRNILDPRIDRVATGAAFDARGPYCGRIWVTQNFVG